jgi:acid phosphatase family membrane protein YuiD
MAAGVTALPTWAAVAVCGLLAQLVKLVLYSAARRHLALTAFAQGNGLPSLPAALLTCLTVLVTLRVGWTAPETGFALVFAVIVVHDSLKLGWLADRNREALVRILAHVETSGGAERRALAYLDPRAHHPAHVAAGIVFGGLFALAIAGAQR